MRYLASISTIFFIVVATCFVASADPRSIEDFSYDEKGSRMNLPGGRYFLTRTFSINEIGGNPSLFAWCDDGDNVLTGGCSADLTTRPLQRSTPALQFDVQMDGENRGRWKLDKNGQPMYRNEGWQCNFGAGEDQPSTYLNIFVICKSVERQP